MKKTSLKILLIITISLIFFMIYTLCLVKLQKKKLFKLAQEKSIETNKKLMVIGDPYTGIIDRISTSYGCGDICIDITGCPKCPDTTIKYKSKLEDVIHKFDTNSVVIFECGTLNCLDNPYEVLDDMKRISGGDIYMKGLNKNSIVDKPYLFFWKYLGRHIYKYIDSSNSNHLVIDGPPNNKEIIIEKL